MEKGNVVQSFKIVLYPNQNLYADLCPNLSLIASLHDCYSHIANPKIISNVPKKSANDLHPLAQNEKNEKAKMEK